MEKPAIESSICTLSRARLLMIEHDPNEAAPSFEGLQYAEHRSIHGEWVPN